MERRSARKTAQHVQTRRPLVRRPDLCTSNSQRPGRETNVQITTRSARHPSSAVNKPNRQRSRGRTTRGDRIMHGQWSSARGFGKSAIVGRGLVISQGRWLGRGSEADRQEALELHMNPKDSVGPKTRNESHQARRSSTKTKFSSPTARTGAMARAWALYAIEGTKRGDIRERANMGIRNRSRSYRVTGRDTTGFLLYAMSAAFMHCID